MTIFFHIVILKPLDKPRKKYPACILDHIMYVVMLSVLVRWVRSRCGGTVYFDWKTAVTRQCGGKKARFYPELARHRCVPGVGTLIICLGLELDQNVS